MNSVLQKLQAAKELYAELLATVNLAVANPTQANIDAAVTAINAGTFAGKLSLKPNYSLDGETYDWPGYAKLIADQIAAINDLISRESLPWIVRGRARP